MLCGTNIICFSKDYSEDPTSNNHVLSRLAKHNKVLWVNSLATRTPNFTSGRDLSKIWHKLGKSFEGPEHIADNLWVYTPIVLPFPDSQAAIAINQQIVKLYISILRRKLGMEEFQLWTFLPTIAPYVGKLGESLTVYYCTDQYSQFESVDTSVVLQQEQDLCRRADLVFATANSLVEDKKSLNPSTYLASHGVEYDHFAQAMDERTSIPADIRDLPHPIIGFFGVIADWCDQRLICATAEKHPEWSIVLVGKSTVETTSMEKFNNIHMVGRKPYCELSGYCKGFDIGIIPFVINELTYHVNPIKLREYISGGLPVVSTPMPEVKPYESNDCFISDGTHANFIEHCEAALQLDASREARIKRAEPMKQETWDAKVEQLGDIVARVANGR